ncbi:phage antirepressor protein [Pseudomonas protegens]|uniref:Phage antirepressor protein n=1 Tax=Pseudomonas protegens TaxID=380021 RepID=A0A2T6GBC1_9PSED|nr:BRO family protein [Pseudomonas protegens]PUA41451.1 phage antirepressor protein [Pseudomonas protegens]
MTNTAKIIPFDFEKHPVRAIAINGDPWFVASDICKALRIANTTQALQSLDDDERSMFNIGRQGNANIINESGLFTLILRSREATTPGTPQHRFRKWVTAEVLPSIRRTGRYEDTTNKMATLIGQTIGTDGFHMLGSLIRGKVSALPATVQRRATMKIWSQTHAAFGVRSAADIPADQLDSARNFIAAYNVHEGEWLGKEEPKPPTFDIPQSASVLQRWLVSYDGNGKQQARPIPFDSFVMSAQDFLARIDMADGIGFTKTELFDCALASINQLRRQVLA